MTDEWTKVELFGPNRDGEIRNYIIADGASVSKGSVLQLLDPRTASCGILANNAVAGIAAESKIPNSGETTIGCWTQGIFEAKNSGTTAVGNYLVASAANCVQPLDVASASVLAASMASIFCRALESAGSDEVINVRLNL